MKIRASCGSTGDCHKVLVTVDVRIREVILSCSFSDVGSIIMQLKYNLTATILDYIRCMWEEAQRLYCELTRIDFCTPRIHFMAFLLP